MTTGKRSRAGEFLIELVVIIAVFAISCAIGVNVLSIADGEARYAQNLTQAKQIASDIAERYKAGESAADIANADKSKSADSTLVCAPSENDGGLTAKITERNEGGISYLDIEISDSDNVYTCLTCARLNRGKG